MYHNFGCIIIMYHNFECIKNFLYGILVVEFAPCKYGKHSYSACVRACVCVCAMSVSVSECMRLCLRVRASSTSACVREYGTSPLRELSELPWPPRT